MTLEGLAKQIETMHSEMRSEFASVRTGIAALDHKMKIEFEETRRVINLGFENVQMVDEKVERRFDETDRAHADNKCLLEAALVSLRREVKRSKRRRAGS